MLKALHTLFALVLALQSYPPPFPRPNATKLLETDQLVVWDIVWPKGEPTPMHRHVYDQVGTYYAAGGRIITSPEGDKRATTTEVGALSTTKRGTLHIEEGASDPPLRAIFIELKNDHPSGRLDARTNLAPPFPREGAAMRLDDKRVTVWDYTWKVSRGSYGWRRDSVLVWLSEGTFQSSVDGGSQAAVHVRAGQMRFVPAGTAESAELVSGTPRLMVFELK
jgi:hypothetical protein